MEDKNELFYQICAAKTYPSLQEFIDFIEDVNVNYSTGNKGLTPLLQLAQSKTNSTEDNLQQIFDILLEKKVDINSKDTCGNNVLLLLCKNYRGNNLYNLIDLFIGKNIEVTCKAENGWDALLLLCKNYQNNNLIDIIKLLIKNGMEVKLSKNDIGNNALLLLCQHYRNNNLFELVNLFIERGIEANYKNQFGWNALHFLCQNDQIKNIIGVIKLLIRNRIDINSKTSSGENALFYLLQNYMEDSLLDESLRLLIRYGIQFRCERRVNKYYKMLQKRRIEVRNGGLEILKYMAEEDLTLGWHSHCKSCEDIL
jgi:ankyrin repeat protein